MLKRLQIDNFAIVDGLVLDFADGMSVLSGETGAGKSILLDALGLTLGDRADSAVVRNGCKRAEISATFAVDELHEVVQWLTEHELDSDGECIIRRTIGSDGRSKGFINGQPVPIASLRNLGEQLVDIHGQHAHQSLLKRQQQRALLDHFAGCSAEVEQVAEHYSRWSSLQDERNALSQAAEERQSRIELLRYQVNELATLGLAVEEISELDESHSRLANAHRLLEGAEAASDALDGGEQQSIATLLQGIIGPLQALRELDRTLGSSCEVLEGALIETREVARELRLYSSELDVDPGLLEEVEQRLTAIHDLARKHHLDPAALPERLTELQGELTELEEMESHLGGLDGEIAVAESAYRQAATALSQQRQQAADDLSHQVSANMAELGMGGGRFEIAVEPIEPTPTGVDKIDFLVSANPGQPLHPLSKVASGGELSRISLAIQVITVSRYGIPTLIFDEVDVGIGGGVAEQVGRKLRQLGQSRQVLCVTHQPQVAALGHNHFRIHKLSSKNTTQTQVERLEEDARVLEVARMLGGVEITEQTRSHAEEMVVRGQSGQ